MDKTLLTVATAYTQAGLCTLPAIVQDKRPAVSSWRQFQSRIPSEQELGSWFSNTHNAVCVVCGEVSGNLEMIDFDIGGQMFDEWASIVRKEAPGLLDKLVVESTPGGGVHAAYRCTGPVEGNQKLAIKVYETDGPHGVVVCNKEYAPRAVGDRWEARVTAIETRGEGGLFLCAPSEGYALSQGSLEHLSTISEQERETLLGAARSLTDEASEPAEPQPLTGVEINPEWLQVDDQPEPVGPRMRPGDDYNERGDLPALLRAHGWSQVGQSGDNQLWRRPGKEGTGNSATFNGDTFHVFSTNAAPFEPKGYSRFSVYALLEHRGDVSAAAQELGRQGFGDDPADFYKDQPGSDVDLSAILDPEQAIDAWGEEPGFEPKTYDDLVTSGKALRTPVIDNLLREGETMNIIAAPKMRKSWLALDMAMAIVTGTPWLGEFATNPGDVLILDNELHEETTGFRLPLVAGDRGHDIDVLRSGLYIDNLRGRLMDFNKLWYALSNTEPGRYKVIILDAFYRFFGTGEDENDNGTVAGIYNKLDQYASKLGCSFVLIHHTKKGSSAGVAVTDMGAGAGAQSRAADCHLTLKPGEDDSEAVLEAAVRSWLPVEPVGLRWQGHTWDMDYTVDVDSILNPKKKKAKPAPEPGSDLVDVLSGNKSPQITVQDFVDSYIPDVAATRASVYIIAKESKISKSRVDDYLEAAQGEGMIELYQERGESKFSPIRIRKIK